MVSGIQWIPDLQTFMLHFNKIINFSFKNQVHKLHLGTMNPIEKDQSCYKMFYCLELEMLYFDSREQNLA